MSSKSTKPGTRKTRESHLVRADTYVKYYVTNTKTRMTDVDIRVDLMNERILAGDHYDLVADAGVILTFEAAAILREQLGVLLAERERSKGPVSVDEKRKAITRTNDVVLVG